MAKPPDACTNMTQLRDEIDRIDEALVDLLSQRAGYIDRAIQLKPAEGVPARAEDRVAQVVANVRALAAARGLDPDLTEALWGMLIEWSIQREQRVID